MSWIRPLRDIVALSCLACVLACGKRTTTVRARDVENLQDARKGFVTKLIKQEREAAAAIAPPSDELELVQYTSPAGKLAAYRTPDPRDGKKHPVIIWLTGGFSSSISPASWNRHQAISNDQSATQYRDAGIAMLYPSYRGGNDNPGVKESFLGEVDDVLAAADYAASLPWVDPQRIYLGGHSVGGTLALLAAESSSNRFRAVFAFGPIHNPAAYGQENVTFDVKDAKEARLRAPIEFLHVIDCPAFLIEGETGNAGPLEHMRKRNLNHRVHCLTIPGEDHFSVLGPANALIASKITADTQQKCSLAMSSKDIKQAIQKAKEANFYPKGDVRTETGAIGVTLYIDRERSREVSEKIAQELAKAWPGIPVVKDLALRPAPPFLYVDEELAPFKHTSVPDAHSLKYCGRGLNEDDGKRLQASHYALSVVLVSAKGEVWQRARQFNQFVDGQAATTKAFVWDIMTRECFHPSEWKRRRVDGWGDGALPDVSSQITMHLYKPEDGNERIRLITLGMEKFALPDVVIEQTFGSASEQLGHFVNVFCQDLASHPELPDATKRGVDLAKLQPDAVAAGYRKSLIADGKGCVAVACMRGSHSEGDPQDALLEIDFRHSRGASPNERSQSAMAEFWGASDQANPVRHDDAILEASKRAKEKLKGLRATFQKGLPLKARLMVKAPFARDDEGNEWMWVEVLKWDDDGTIGGMLVNRPNFIKTLSSGAKVTVREDQLFDYIYYHEDGSSEGNETGKLMERQMEGKE